MDTLNAIVLQELEKKKHKNIVWRNTNEPLKEVYIFLNYSSIYFNDRLDFKNIAYYL